MIASWAATESDPRSVLSSVRWTSRDAYPRRVARHRPGPVRSIDYADASQRRMSWAALLAVEAWCHRAGLSDADIDEWLDHAWRWSTISSETFDDWYRALPRLQGIWPRAKGAYRILGHLVEKCARASVPAGDLETLVILANDIVYGNLFGGLQFLYFDQALDGIATLLERYELGLPPPEYLPTSSRQDHHGWGFPVDGATMSTIRNLDWTSPG
jgi:hypothetical protein